MPTKYTNEWLHLNLDGGVFIVAHCSIRSSPRILSEIQVSLGSTKDGVRLPSGLPFNDIFVSPKHYNRKLFWEGKYLTGRICLLLSQSSATIRLNVV